MRFPDRHCHPRLGAAASTAPLQHQVGDDSEYVLSGRSGWSWGSAGAQTGEETTARDAGPSQVTTPSCTAPTLEWTRINRRTGETTNPVSLPAQADSGHARRRGGAPIPR